MRVRGSKYHLIVILVSMAFCRSQTQPADDAGRRLMKTVVKFFGGEQNLSAVKSVQERFSERHFTWDNRLVVNADTVRIIEFPDKVRFTLINGGLTKTLGPNGAFGLNHGKLFDLASLDTEMLDDVKREVINIAQHVNDPKYVFRIAGTKKVGAMTATLIDIDADGARTQWGVDAESGELLIATEDFNDSLLAGHVHQTVHYSKYKKLGGLNLPVESVIHQDFSHAYSDALERRAGLGGSAGVNFYGIADLTIEKINPMIPKDAFDKSVK
jgi:hypothetical protein